MKVNFILISLLCVFGLVKTSFSQNEVKINHDGTNGFVVRTDGSVEMEGNATVWDDIMIPGFSTAKSSNAPTFAVFIDGVYLNYFADVATNENQVYFTVQFPHSWKGTAIKPHIHWSPRSTVSIAAVVRWGLEYTWVEYNSATPNTFPATDIVYVDAPCASGSQQKHLIASFGDIIPSTSQDGISSMMVCRVFRNSSHGNDTYTGDAGFLQFDIHYEKDTEGSREPFEK